LAGDPTIKLRRGLRVFRRSRPALSQRIDCRHRKYEERCKDEWQTTHDPSTTSQPIMAQNQADATEMRGRTNVDSPPSGRLRPTSGHGRQPILKIGAPERGLTSSPVLAKPCFS